MEDTQPIPQPPRWDEAAALKTTAELRRKLADKILDEIVELSAQLGQNRKSREFRPRVYADTYGEDVKLKAKISALREELQQIIERAQNGYAAD